MAEEEGEIPKEEQSLKDEDLDNDHNAKELIKEPPPIVEEAHDDARLKKLESNDLNDTIATIPLKNKSEEGAERPKSVHSNKETQSDKQEDDDVNDQILESSPKLDETEDDF